MKERKAFNFYRSFYDVALLLPELERSEFIMAICHAQFTGEIIEPELPMAKLAFTSQLHSIEKQLVGFKWATETIPKDEPTEGPSEGTKEGPYKEPSVQEQEQVQEQVQEKEERTTKKGSKKLILNESELKFIDWFNAQFIPVLNRKGKFNSMTATDRNNLIALKESYPNAYDWEHAFTVMTQSEWVIENNMATIAHFLRHDNFTKYVNQQIKQTKYKAPWD